MHIFHMNLLRYGGNNVQLDSYGQIVQVSQKQQGLIDTLQQYMNQQLPPVDVAGFTEVMPLINPSTLVAGLHDLATLGLGMHLPRFILVNAGTSVFNYVEYIAIAINAHAAGLCSVGRLNPHPRQNPLHEIMDYPRRYPYIVNGLPPVPGYRSIVYVDVLRPTARHRIGFCHEVYVQAANRTISMGQLPAMVALGDLTFVGGDFNVDPHVMGTDRTGRLYPYHTGNNTTQYHEYDWFVSRIAPTQPPDVRVTQTPFPPDPNTTGSDHTGVGLIY